MSATILKMTMNFLLFVLIFNVSVLAEPFKTYLNSEAHRLPYSMHVNELFVVLVFTTYHGIDGPVLRFIHDTI